MSEREERVRKVFSGRIFFLVSKRIYEGYFPKAEKWHFDYYNGRYPFMEGSR